MTAALAGIGGCCGAVTTYALLRVVQRLIAPDADPALVIWSAHSGYFWRAWTAAYVGGMVAAIVWLIARRDPARVSRVLATGVVIAAVASGAQGVLVP